jgi:hypothetical protein
MVQRPFRFFHEPLSITLFAMVHRILRVHDRVMDVTGFGRPGVHHGHTKEHPKHNQNERATVELADHLCFPSWLEFTAKKTVEILKHCTQRSVVCQEDLAGCSKSRIF